MRISLDGKTASKGVPLRRSKLPGSKVIAPKMAFNVALERLLDHYLRDKAYSADSLQELGGVQSRLHQQIDERMASRSLHFQHPVP